MPASTALQGVYQSSFFGGPVPPVSGPPFFMGNLWFVAPTGGSDGNVGSQPGQPFKTLAGALKHVVPNNNDVVFLQGTTTLTATLAWNVSGTHLIGVGQPGEVGQQAEITYAGATTLTPLVHVTGSNCYFSGVNVVHAGTVASTAQVCWQDSGNANVYDHMRLFGMAATGQAGQTGSRSLLIDGGAGQSTPTTGQGDMLFTSCTFGGTGVQRTAANSTLEIQTASPRNIFRRCNFLVNTSSAGALHMLLAASSVDQFMIFDECSFIATSKATSGVGITQAFSINATQTANILFRNSFSVGATKLETTPSNYVFVTEPAPSAGSGPYAVNNT